jgi:hypothetical protein
MHEKKQDRWPVADAPARAVAEGEDRGTAGRWRATRERVRMVD